MDPTLLTPGLNVLAAEVHQVAIDSSDITFDAGLSDGSEEVSVDFYGFGEESDWVASGQYADITLVRNRFFYDLFRAFPSLNSPFAPEMTYCTLTLEGVAQGTYTMGESVKRDDDRVDIPLDGGAGTNFVLKLDDVGFHQSTISYGGWKFVYPDEKKVTPEQTLGAEAVLVAWEAAVLSRTSVLDHVDLPSSVDWVLLQELAANVDAWQLSIHVVKEEGKPIRFVPWDFDLSSGGYPSWDCDAEGWLVSYTPRSEMVAAMADDPVWLAAWRARVSLPRRRPFGCDGWANNVDARQNGLDGRAYFYVPTRNLGVRVTIV